MAGWVGTFWDLKHVGVTPDLDAILAQDREGILFSRHAAHHAVDAGGLEPRSSTLAPRASGIGSLGFVASGATFRPGGKVGLHPGYLGLRGTESRS